MLKSNKHMKNLNRTTPPIAQWWHLARQYADLHGADLCDGLLYVGRGTDRADVTTDKPGQTYAQLVENPIGNWHWEQRTIEAEPAEFDEWDALTDRWEASQETHYDHA